MMMPMGFIWLLLFVGAGLLLWRVFMNKQQEGPVAPPLPQQESAHEILLKELAKGNLTEEEYLAKKKYMD